MLPNVFSNSSLRMKCQTILCRHRLTVHVQFICMWVVTLLGVFLMLDKGPRFSYTEQEIPYHSGYLAIVAPAGNLGDLEHQIWPISRKYHIQYHKMSCWNSGPFIQLNPFTFLKVLPPSMHFSNFQVRILLGGKKWQRWSFWLEDKSAGSIICWPKSNFLFLIIHVHFGEVPCCYALTMEIHLIWVKFLTFFQTSCANHWIWVIFCQNFNICIWKLGH